MAKAVAESAAAAQRLRREAEKGIRFRRSAGKLVQASRVAKGMNIGTYYILIGVCLCKNRESILVTIAIFFLDTDPLLMAQQLSARPSIVSVASEEGTYSLQTQPLPSDFGFVPSFKVKLFIPVIGTCFRKIRTSK